MRFIHPVVILTLAATLTASTASFAFDGGGQNLPPSHTMHKKHHPLIPKPKLSPFTHLAPVVPDAAVQNIAPPPPVVVPSTSGATRIVSFTFDDAPKSVLTVGVPILDKYHLRGTLYISTRNATRDGYMNWDDIDAVTLKGWELGAHTYTHARLTNLTDAQIDDELRISTEDFVKHGYHPVDFASPFGSYDDRVLGILKQHYQSHRAAWPDGSNTLTPDPYRIQSYSINQTTTLEEVNSIFTKTWYTGGWVVFQFHFLYPKGEVVSEKYGTNLLADMVEQAHKMGFTILTVKEALKELHR